MSHMEFLSSSYLAGLRGGSGSLDQLTVLTCNINIMSPEEEDQNAAIDESFVRRCMEKRAHYANQVKVEKEKVAEQRSKNGNVREHT